MRQLPSQTAEGQAQVTRRPTSKSYLRGTHRTVAPAETLKHVGGHAAAFGITRLANVTGLDYLGIPVFMAVRPNARGLSVAQGKGLDDASARASALMESLEHAHAETVQLPVTPATYTGLKRRRRVADPARLPQPRNRRFRTTVEIPWIEGNDLVSGEPIWIPFELVHLDYSAGNRARRYFTASSNGLASGNHRLEAVCAALCELIERDAVSLWRRRGENDRASRRLALASITDADARPLLALLKARGMEAAVWDITSDTGVAAFLCRLTESPDNDRSGFGAFWGSGCHLDRGVALIRAITEAAQSRLTYIAGSRDDLMRKHYGEPEGDAFRRMVRDRWEEERGGRNFADVPHAATKTFETDLARLLKQLMSAGLDQAILVDLTRKEIGIPVVRMIVPGLEGSSEHPLYAPGTRALSVARA